MPISIVCSQCRTPYTVPDRLAGKTVSCKHCNALLDVPLPAIAGDAGLQPETPSSAGGVSGVSRYESIVGKPTPLFVEILGIHMQWSEEFAVRDIFLLLWSLRHIVLLVLVIIFWMSFAANTGSAQMAAPFFFGAGIAMLLISWVQISRISRDAAVSLGGGTGDSSLAPHILSSLLLVVTDFKAAIPAVRTFFLALLLLLASLSLASQAGNWKYILPINALPSFNNGSGTHPQSVFPAPPEESTPSTEPAPTSAPAIPAPPTATQEGPIPPPDDTPVPPPPG